MNKKGSGNGHGAIAAIESHLHPAALSVSDDEDILKCCNQRVGDVIGKSPERKEGGDQDE